jgi:hypothetical protein
VFSPKQEQEQGGGNLICDYAFREHAPLLRSDSGARPRTRAWVLGRSPPTAQSGFLRKTTMRLVFVPRVLLPTPQQLAVLVNSWDWI